MELSYKGLLAEILETVAEGIAVFDEKPILVLSNPSFKRLNPLIADLIRPGLSWEILIREAVQRGSISEADGRRLRAMEEQLMDGVQDVQAVELRTFTDAVHEIALRQASSEGFILRQRDITDRKKYEADRQQADLLLRKVLEACPANVIMSRIGDGQILYRSPAATELLGPTRCYYDHFASREERADFITALLPDGRLDNNRVTGRRSNGDSFPCAISARVIEYRGEDVMVSNIVDITKELDLQRTLAEQREQLFQAEKLSALGELLAGVAHELNNPLSVVVGHALMMREETSDPAALRRIGKISDAADRCAKIVRSFLGMARQLPTRLAPVDLKEAVETAIEALQLSSSGLHCGVDVIIRSDLPQALGDADQITQVFINLISNADQAIESSGIGGRVAISGRFDAQTNMIEIRVADDGPGISKEIRNRIFDPLFTTKDVGKGTGIGLAFCHRVLASHNGQIRLESSNERGATFLLRLPVSDEPRHATGGMSVEPLQLPPARVLVVEDELEVADLIHEILSREHYVIDQVFSAEAALTRIAAENYDIVLSDLNMSGMGGRGFYERILRDHPNLAPRIGFITGDTMSPAARVFLDESSRPYLEKPVAPSELRRLARRLLEE